MGSSLFLQEDVMIFVNGVRRTFPQCIEQMNQGNQKVGNV